VGRGAKSRRAPSAQAPEFQANNSKNNNNNFPVTVKIKTSGYRPLECFIATLPTGRLVHVGETFNRFADFGLPRPSSRYKRDGMKGRGEERSGNGERGVGEGQDVKV